MTATGSTLGLATALAAFIMGSLAASACEAATSVPSIYVAADGDDANNGTRNAPVLSFDRAYRLAKPGQTVEVAAGDYGPQTLGLDPSKRSSRRVVFRPSRDAVVTVRLIDFGQAQLSIRGPQHMALKGMSVGLVRAWAGADDLIWQNIDARNFEIFDATNVTIRGGDYGPCQAPRDGRCVSWIAGRAANILVDGAYIHDITSSNLVSYHVDALFLRGSNNVTIRNSRFRGNMITNIRVQDQSCCMNQNLTIENNWFAPSLQGDGVSIRGDAIDIDRPTPGLLIRNNSFAETTGPQLLGNQTGARIIGNLLRNSGCVPGAVYSHNVFIPWATTTGQTPCGPTDKKVSSFGYVNGPGFDYHITRRSPAVNSGDSRNCPTRDIDGHRRPAGIKCDAGSQERGVLVCRQLGKRTGTAKHRRYATKEIDRSRLAAYLKRGDRLGKCPRRVTQ
jgi:hypothetical protein